MQASSSGGEIRKAKKFTSSGYNLYCHRSKASGVSAAAFFFV
jgi:hypothetical protein